MSDLSLEIHHLDVQGGDSTAIIVKDLEQEKENGGKKIYSMLIDSGSEGRGSAYLKSYLEEHKIGPFDCIIATHYHQDHIQGFSQADIEFKRFIDNGHYTESSGKKMIDPLNGIGVGAQSQIFKAYAQRVQSQVKNGAQRIEIPFIEKGFSGTAEPLKFELGDGTGITMTCYCANGVLANGEDILGGQKRRKNKGINPNDVSLALVLEWGDFLYMTAGDLSGDHDLSSYYNIEKDLVNYLSEGPLKGKSITVFKASHHGSEHSNHAELLKKLNPKTVIVCCNIMKQVPSPIFLKRLVTHFNDKKEDVSKPIVVFTNTMKVFKNNDRYKQLQELKSHIAEGNVEFSGDIKRGDEVYASNLGIKCAVIRRRVLDGKPKAYEGMLLKGAKIIRKSGYEITLMPRAENEAKNIGDIVTFLTWDIKRSWDPIVCNTGKIFAGFERQAKEMARWIASDKEPSAAQTGMDYINMYYPGLLSTINNSDDDKNLKDDLEKKMKDLFNSSFHIKDGLYVPKKTNNLTSDEKATMYKLLMDNKYQEEFNTAIEPGQSRSSRHGPPRTVKWKTDNAWNKDEPYPKSGGVKRIAGSSIDPRPGKKPKLDK